MSRLTYYRMKGSENDGWYLKPGITQEQATAKLAAMEEAQELENLGLSPSERIAALIELRAYRAAASLEQVREWAGAFEEGRLVVLPCKIGDTVYIILDSLCSHLNSHHTRHCTECNGNEIECNHYDGGSAKEICTVKFAYRLMRSIGKTVFLTREEAQAALDAQKGGTDA